RAPICAGETILSLSTISKEGITGTWSPALDNTLTKTYTFMPFSGQCVNAVNTTIKIIVNELISPVFDVIEPICFGEKLEKLPLVSTNNISGTWTPEIDNTQTTTYTFTPDDGPCVTEIKTTISIQVFPVPNAGLSTELVVCITSSKLILFEELEGSPDVGGLWTNELGETLDGGHLATFNPLKEKGGAFVYTITTTHCGAMSTRILISVLEKPIIKSIHVVDFSNDNVITIHMEDSESYQYSIDGFNYQSENIFNNVVIGDYTVYVKNDCFEVEKEVQVCGAPKFFTPNNDGENDTWQVVCFENDPTARVTIFDRFGKVLKVFKPSARGWDGTYIGELSPSTDYWFVLEYTKNDVRMRKRGHFSLIRRFLE
ncbi:MAG: hypothetical protein COB98_11315, partial [Flavobacteriaceae bacterium]